MTTQPEYKELSEKIEGVKDTLGKQMTDVLVKIGELTVSVQSLSGIKNEIENVRDTARDADSRSRQAHKRIDRIETEINPMIEHVNKQPEINTSHAERITKLETMNKWVATSIIGAIIVAIMNLILK